MRLGIFLFHQLIQLFFSFSSLWCCIDNSLDRSNTASSCSASSAFLDSAWHCFLSLVDFLLHDLKIWVSKQQIQLVHKTASNKNLLFLKMFAKPPNKLRLETLDGCAYPIFFTRGNVAWNRWSETRNVNDKILIGSWNIDISNCFSVGMLCIDVLRVHRIFLLVTWHCLWGCARPRSNCHHIFQTFRKFSLDASLQLWGKMILARILRKSYFLGLFGSFWTLKTLSQEPTSTPHTNFWTATPAQDLLPKTALTPRL